MYKHPKLLELIEIIKPAYEFFDPDYALNKDDTLDKLCTIIGQVMGFADTWNFEETYKEDIETVKTNVRQYPEALKIKLDLK